MIHNVHTQPKATSAAALQSQQLAQSAFQQQQKDNNQPKLPFDEVIACNIGNPHDLGQKPITFFRQVLSLIENRSLLHSEHVSSIYPRDVILRATRLLESIPGGSGAYTNSQGLPVVRKQVAEFISRRDGFPSDPDSIFLTDGASPAVQKILTLIIRSPTDGIMIPIPQYPLYSASISLFHGARIDYYLDESSNWGLELSELERSWNQSVAEGLTPRALVIINPGNPTGQTLTKESMQNVVKFCHNRRLVLLADEVYQENVYHKEVKPFVSFKCVLRELQQAIPNTYDNFELVSFHSISKGFVGECGKRGGYMELVGFHPEVRTLIYKLASISLCPNVVGQILLDLMCSPPVEGDESYQLYVKERDEIYNGLKERALSLVAALNKLEGVTCNPAEGAMYAFPRITIPEKAVAQARKANLEPDAFYVMSLLDETGICVVPGSGFGQRPGTWHFRTTFLPQKEKIPIVIQRLSAFHKKFMQQYS